MPPKQGMSQEKKNVITSLLEMYDIQTAGDLQAALKDLMGETIQEMLESEFAEDLGHEKHERTATPKSNYRNGHKPKRLKTSMGEMEIAVPQDRNAEFEPK